MTHARLSPSNHRWVYCPGSVREEAKYPNISGEAAIEGTSVHLLIEMCLLQGKMPADFKGETIGEGHHDKPKGWKVTDDRIDKAEYVFAYLSRHPDTQIEPESKSNPGAKFGRDDWYGTADITLRKPDYLEVVDYKNGRTFVSEKDNSQLISYGYGKWEGESNVRLTIIQPKTNVPIRYVDITGVELEEAAIKLNEAAKRTDDPDAPLIKGDHCHWCKHKPNCEEYNKVAEEVIEGTAIQQHFSKLINKADSLTEKEIVELLDAEPIVMALFDKVREVAQNKLESGKVLNGWAMKPGRKGNKKWTNEEEVEKYLKSLKVKVSEFKETKLKTPAQIEKLKKVDPEKLKEYYSQDEGKLTLSKSTKVKF